jgi:uncharacterized protein YcbK (DUF882 family)
MTPLKIATRIGLALSMSFNIAALNAQAQTVNLPQDKSAKAAAHGKALTQKPATKPTLKPKPTMVLQFYNLHTGESLTLRRHKGEALSPAATEFMRDYREDKTTKMDPKLFDLLDQLQQQIKKQHPRLNVTFDVVSSYRTPETNENLREAGGTQARHSQHMRGKAMDIRVPGISTVELRNTATCLNGGGVGYYAAEAFVHVDTGRPRYWPSHDYLSQLSCHTPGRDVVATRKPRSGPRKG